MAKSSEESLTDGSVAKVLEHFKERSFKEASLTLEDGEVITGISFGAESNVSGEVVFNTGMVGYPESLTDPSYRGQILVLTYPLVGNYGVPDENELDEYGLLKYFESDKIQITALIISDYSHDHSHYSSNMSLSQWLIKHNIPGLYNIDTRQLTKKLRKKGSMLGKIEFPNTKPVELHNPYSRNLVAEVSCTEVREFNPPSKENSPKSKDQTLTSEKKESEEYREDSVFDDESDEVLKSQPKIIAVDCGIKNNIIRYLAGKGVYLKVVPWDYDFNEEHCDGLFLSNGPGDPVMAAETIRNVRKFMKNRPETPLFGICLGNQILALAAGGKTYKMKFGNRGMNQPVIDLRTSRCYISPQNHGFAVDERSLPRNWKPFFRNANDHSNEGIIHTFKPFFSVQFHPEAQGGPTDTEFLFDMFLSRIRKRHLCEVTVVDVPNMLSSEAISSVLLLGSGGLSIGQAGEFDYSGSQAIKALKEENVRVILINPNIATVQTGDDMADEVYFLPVTPEYVTKVIAKEQPDGILLQFGGQTALNCGIELQKSGVFKRFGVKVLGTPIETIELTEDRGLFAKCLEEVNEKVAPSAIALTVNEAAAVANSIGYPVLLRSAFALGGLGSGFAANEEELRALASKAFSNSDQVIIDKSLRGWKEVEYEVVRDAHNNCITVCNMENFDPLGIHTGDSIVVAPSQTLSNDDYYMLRSAAIKIVRHLGVVGECNIQYALDPFSEDYCVIEVNARLSRSSALASKATGYPLAYVAAKLAMGRSLPTIKNSITKVTQACFEPALDYCVVKIPRWDMKKFNLVEFKIGSAMKSVGEVMAIDRKFEAAFSKALRMVNDHCDGFGYVPSRMLKLSEEQLNKELQEPSDVRVFAIALAFRRGYSVAQIHKLTAIDPWFLCKLRNISVMEEWLQEYKDTSFDEFEKDEFPIKLIKEAKQYGFSDLQIARCMQSSELEVRNLRQRHNIFPFVKQIDTLAAEFPAFTNYLYMTYNATGHDLTFNEHGIMVLGCGAYRIGSSCEFDWCAVSAVRTLRSIGLDRQYNRNPPFGSSFRSANRNMRRSSKKKKLVSSIVVNYNPETVSTDYDECDRLYFEELSFERVLDIYELEQSAGVIVSVGGQISNNLAMPLYEQGVKILGTQPDSIDNAENRHRFSKLLDGLHIDQPAWCEVKTYEEALEFSERVGYPVLIRPSYVLSGAAMNVVTNPTQLKTYLAQATNLSREHPVVISNFISGAKEVELDAVAKNGIVLNYAISEHIENAGVHSGDATLVLPAQNLYVETIKRVKKITLKIAYALNITGPFNIQFLCKDNHIKVIECNLRASRSFPFVSKTFNVNFIDLATRAMLEQFDKTLTGQLARPHNFNLFDMDYVCIKSPLFSFTRLEGADPVLRVEMASTGEVACFGDNKHEALLKAFLSSKHTLPIPNPALAKILPSNRLRTDYIKQDVALYYGTNHKYLFASLDSTVANSPVKGVGVADEEEETQGPDFQKTRSTFYLDEFDNRSREVEKPVPIKQTPPQSARSKIVSRTALSDITNASSSPSQHTTYSEENEKDVVYPCNILVAISQQSKIAFLGCARQLVDMGYKLHATEGTHQFFKQNDIESVLVPKPSSGLHPNAIDLISDGSIHLVINVPGNTTQSELTDGYHIRRKAVDFNITLISNIQLAKALVRALAKKYLKSYEYHADSKFMHIKSWKEYMTAAHRV